MTSSIIVKALKLIEHIQASLGAITGHFLCRSFDFRELKKSSIAELSLTLSTRLIQQVIAPGLKQILFNAIVAAKPIFDV
jgi:hypothetical protein